MAKICSVVLLISLGMLAYGQHIEHPDGRSDNFHSQDDAGNFNFGYDIGRADGSRDTRQERGDGHGNVIGSYSLQDADGRSRVVDYQAGEHGFQAVVRTNEPGTANQSPAFVSINSDAPRDAYSGRAYGPARRQYYRPSYRPYRPHYTYDPYHHRSHGYGDHSHSSYSYDYPHHYY